MRAGEALIGVRPNVITMSNAPSSRDPHWIWYWLPLVALLAWAYHSGQKDRKEAKELDKICDADCRHQKRVERIYAEAKRDLSPAEYQRFISDTLKSEREGKAEERAETERRSHLTDEERELLETAEQQQYQ